MSIWCKLRRDLTLNDPLTMPSSPSVPTVYFDEAGNTGAHLLDPEQPVFTLASVDFVAEECADLLAIVKTPQAKEAKFSSLRKSASGQARLVHFIESPLLTPARAKVVITHKPYMVVGKMVDLIVEPIAHAANIDLYKDGSNIGLTNLHFHIGPLFCGREPFDRTLAAFIAMVREQTPQAKANFFAAVKALHAGAVEQFKSDLIFYLAAESSIDRILEGVDYHALDPAIPAFFYLCSAWGQQLQKPFHVVHDSSKPITARKEMLEGMMTTTEVPGSVGYDRRKFEFPLRATGIQFEDSKLHPGLQVADLIAGTLAYYAGRVASGELDDFSRKLDAAGIERFNVQAIWPELKVTPEALGTTAQIDDSDAIEVMTAYMRGR